MNYSTTIYSVTGGGLTITLDRPDQPNACTVEMANEFADLQETPMKTIRSVSIVVTGAARAFCAGMAGEFVEEGAPSEGLLEAACLL